MSETVPHTVLLDTHAWLWLEFADARIQNSPARKAVELARTKGGVIISAISVWEVALLASKSRIQLYQECNQWVKVALSAPGVILQPLKPEIAIESTRLPGEFHADPADRFLVATSRYLNAPIVTADARILDYGKQGYVRTLPV
jgi:PIN domain nuclease of toxin-antitoxin system